MAVQNLEVVVDVDIKQAVAALRELQSELEDLSEKISEVDARGSEGIDINTTVDSLDAELARMAFMIQAFESANSIDLETNVNTDDFGMISGPRRTNPINMVDPPRGGAAGLRRTGGSRLSRLMSELPDNLSETLDRLRGFNIRMSDIHNAFAALVPLLLVFVGAMPAAIGALYTLAGAALATAAAFAAIAGFGALGVGLQDGQFSMDRLTEVWNDIRDSFIEAFAPLAERLEPLFRDAVDGLERFFNAVASQGDALMQLTDEAKAFGQFIIDFMPTVLRTLAAVAEAFSGVFANIGSFLESEFVNIIRAVVQETQNALPAVSALINMVISALPALMDLSVGFARVSTAVIWLITQIGRILTLFGLLGGEQIGLVIAALLSFASAVALANALTGLFAGTIVGTAVSAMANFAASAIFGAEAFAALSVAEMVATAALIAFLSVITLGLFVAFGSAVINLSSDFLGLAGSIDTAASSLRDFNRISGMTSGIDNPYGGNSGDGSGKPPKGGGMTVINMERTGNKEKDNSDADKVKWHQGRTTGGSP